MGKDCGCNKRAQRVTSDKARKSATETPKAPARSATRPTVQGGTQSFALEVGGRTQTFGSALERDAAALRTGGKIVP